MGVMSDCAKHMAPPGVIRAVATGRLKPQGHKFEVTAKGGDRDQRFIEWPLLRIYGTVLAITLAGIGYAFLLPLRGDSPAFCGPPLAWGFLKALLFLSVFFAVICAPPGREAPRLP